MPFNEQQKRGLGVFNKTKNQSYNELHELEAKLLCPYLKSSRGFYYASTSLVNDLDDAKFPFSSDNNNLRYKEIKDFWEQEEIEKYRDEETKKAEYLLFHPKGPKKLFPNTFFH